MSSNSIKRSNISNSQKWLFALCAALFFIQFNGYYAVLAPVVSAGISSRSFTIPVRVFVLLLSLILLKWFKLPALGDERRQPILCLFFFWGVYSLRLIYDAFTLPETWNVSPKELPLFGIGVCLVPMIGAMAAVRSQDARKWMYWGYFLGSAAFCGLALVLYRELLSEGVARARGGDVDGTVSSINLGYCSVATILMVYAYFMSEKGKLRWLMLAVGAIAMPVMLLSGNRGCLLAFAISMAPFLLSLFSSKDKGKAVVGVMVGVAFVAGYIVWSMSYGAAGLDRLIETFTDMSDGGEGDGGRMLLWSTAWNNFLSSPIWGEASLVFYDGGSNWAHNIFMDVLNATGLLGFVPFIYAFFHAFKKSIEQMKNLTSTCWIGGCFMVGFVSMLFSNAAFLAPGFWIFMGMVLMLPKVTEKRK